MISNTSHTMRIDGFQANIINNSNNYHHPPPTQSNYSSLDIHSTNPLGGGSPLATRSINLPRASYSSSPIHSAPVMSWKSNTGVGGAGMTPASSLTLSSSPLTVDPAVVPHSPTLNANKQTFQSGIGASLAAQKMNGGGTAMNTTQTSSSHMHSLNLQRQDSVPSSCCSGSTISPIDSQLTSAACSPAALSSFEPTTVVGVIDPLLVSAPASPPAAPAPNPISLWFGLEDETHARSVLAQYATLLSVTTQRKANTRAPLEFIGRVKREKIDLNKLHRLVDRHVALTRCATRQRYASAADKMVNRCDSSNKPKRGSSPCLSRFNSSSSSVILGSSPLSDSTSMLSSPLHRLPAKGSFATLDLVSIYSRDTLPLGLVFPLIRHEWVVSVWNELDGVPETQIPLHTEYEEINDGEPEEETDEEDIQALVVLDLFAQSTVKPHKIGLNSSQKCSPMLSPTNANVNTAAATASDPLWHPAASAATTVTTSVASSSSSSPPAPVFDEPASVSFLYNLPIFSQDVTGSFHTFGCKLVRPLGELGHSSKGNKYKRNKKANSQETQLLPSSLGYSGAQNDCIYNCLQSLGRKVKCNGAAGDSTDEAACIKQQGTTDAAAPHTAEDTDQNNTSGTTDEADESSSSSDDDGDDDDDADLDDNLDDLDDDDDAEGGFEFGGGSDDDDGVEFTRHVGSSHAVAIKKQNSTSSVRFGGRHDDDDDEDSDYDSESGGSLSFGNSLTSPVGSHTAAGSLGDELQAQLMALGLKKAPSASSRAR